MIIETYPNLQLHAFVLAEDRLHLEVDAHRAHEGRGERVVGVAKQKRRLAHAAVANDQNLEHVVKVLVDRILLPVLVLPSHALGGKRKWNDD